MNDRGYIIRVLNLWNGSVYYRGQRDTFSQTKAGLTPSDTYTLSGAKRALSNLRRLCLDPDRYQYNIERLDEYYMQETGGNETDLRSSIDHAMLRLDELWNGNNFDNGDKMRINEVRAVLRKIREEME